MVNQAVVFGNQQRDNSLADVIVYLG